jgi:tRNA-binding EMAP/Myf-like protein
VIVGIIGACVGKVLKVCTHPKGTRIWLTSVDLGDGADPLQIVFGGKLKLNGGELVAVAPPGSRAVVQTPGLTEQRVKKMRVRRYRGERSHGMLCSLDELGWVRGGPDEVAILCGLEPGFELDSLSPSERPQVVKGWEWAKSRKKEALAEELSGSYQAEPRLAVH